MIYQATSFARNGPLAASAFHVSNGHAGWAGRLANDHTNRRPDHFDIWWFKTTSGGLVHRAAD